MDTVTQQNAALVEEAAAAAESLQEQAGTLMDVVSIFKLDSAAVSAPRAAAKVTALPAAAKAMLPKPRYTSPAAPRKVANGAPADIGDWEEF